MGACQSSTSHVDSQAYSTSKSSKNKRFNKSRKSGNLPEGPADLTDVTGSHTNDELSPTKTVASHGSDASGASPLRPSSFAARAAYFEKSGGPTSGTATIGKVPFKSGENNQVGPSGAKYEVRGGETQGASTVGVVPWKSGEDNAVRSSDVKYQMKGGPTGADLNPQEYTGRLIPGKDFSARSFVPVMGASTGTPSFAMSHKEKGKIYDEVERTKCSLCLKSSLGIMCPCECGKDECEEICHTACASRIQAAPSLSYPGTPAPRLPLILCSTGVSYTLKKKVVKESADFKEETKVAILKDDEDSGDEIPRGSALGKALPEQADFTAETKVAILRDSDKEKEIPRGVAEGKPLPESTDFTSETNVSILQDNDGQEVDEDLIEAGEPLPDEEPEDNVPVKDNLTTVDPAVSVEEPSDEMENSALSKEESSIENVAANPVKENYSVVDSKDTLPTEEKENLKENKIAQEIPTAEDTELSGGGGEEEPVSVEST